MSILDANGTPPSRDATLPLETPRVVPRSLLRGIVVNKKVRQKEKSMQLARVPQQIRETVCEFITGYLKDPQVAGGLLTGSYATGVKVSRYSDIDISFVLTDTASKRKRGNKIIDGYLVECTADPFRYIRKLFDENHTAGIRHIARKYATGIVLFDRGGVAELQQEAACILQQSIPNAADDERWIEMAKYYLFDQLLNIRALQEERSGGFQFTYFAHIQKILDTYGKFLGVEVLRPERIHQLLSDQEFCAKYGIAQFPDQHFMKLVIVCMECVDLEKLAKLNNYIIEIMGGFTTDGWMFEVDC